MATPGTPQAFQRQTLAGPGLAEIDRLLREGRSTTTTWRTLHAPTSAGGLGRTDEARAAYQWALDLAKQGPNAASSRPTWTPWQPI
jgi:predicted RNA polymerase sigma factor